MEYVLKRELFDRELVPSIQHLILGSGSGMSAWLDSVRKAKPSWMGLPPVEVTVAYVDGEPVGWSGIGTDFEMYDIENNRHRLPVIATYVLDSHRGHGIGTALIKDVLNHHKKSHIIGSPISVDTARWDSRKHIEAAGFRPLYYGHYYVDYNKEPNVS